MKLDEFLNLASGTIAEIVRAAGPKVCVFPINGTRRWFMLERPPVSPGDLAEAYLAAIIERHIELYRLFFEHGITTLLTPAFGPDLLERGEEYTTMALDGLGRLATHPAFTEFFDVYDVRVRFYGDYARHLAAPQYAPVLRRFEQVTVHTAAHGTNRLFFGLFAHDASEAIARLAVEHYQEHGTVPDRRTLVELYYGTYVDDISLFIGFDKCAAFDMPLVATGNEDLYFTVCPSLYLDERQLRTILYDHLYTRQTEERDYSELDAKDWDSVRRFYRANRGKTIGVGARHAASGFWYPLPEVELTEGFYGS